MKIPTARLLLVFCWLGLLLAACGGAPQPAAAPTAEGPVQRGAASGATTPPRDVSCDDPTMKPQPSTISATDKAAILKEHNDARPGPDLVWDDGLAQFAQGWAVAWGNYGDVNNKILLLNAHSSLKDGSYTWYREKYGKTIQIWVRILARSRAGLMKSQIGIPLLENVLVPVDTIYK